MTNQMDSELMSDSRDQEEVEMSLCGRGDGLTDLALINWTFAERAHTSTRSTFRPPGPARPGDASQDATEARELMPECVWLQCEEGWTTSRT